ncbi:MAG: 7-cyano-7-deazaguanine synthase QueC [Phycisphaerales bacterium]|nr:7-cyano-7-deazaguanine synthase QueC [Phycisphaerales bacterium]
MTRAVVLLSGGLDSAVALAIAREQVGAGGCFAISFDYGQRHGHELAAARRVAGRLGVASERHVVVRVGLDAIGGSALTDTRIEVPKGRGAGGAGGAGEMAHGVPVTYVPARNLVFLSCAAGFAETVGASRLYIGVNAVDYSGYPDCRSEFIEAFERAANLGTKAGVEALARGEVGGALRVCVPLVRMSKAAIIRRGAELGVDFALTHSCYDPVVRDEQALACGRCDSCVIRRRGFEEAGVRDTTRYA